MATTSEINIKKTYKNFYISWSAMKQRCKRGKRYAGRGIKVCKDWLVFNNFFVDMYPTYEKGLTIDRVNNNEDYCKDNCRWATRKEQASNRSSNHFYEYCGISDTVVNWANYFNLKRSTLEMRLRAYGWSMDRALFTHAGE